MTQRGEWCVAPFIHIQVRREMDVDVVRVDLDRPDGWVVEAWRRARVDWAVLLRGYESTYHWAYVVSIQGQPVQASR